MTLRKTSPCWPDPLAPAELDRLHDEARRRAGELRREALDDVWRGALRLASRLARHRSRRTSALPEA